MQQVSDFYTAVHNARAKAFNFMSNPKLPQNKPNPYFVPANDIDPEFYISKVVKYERGYGSYIFNFVPSSKDFVMCCYAIKFSTVKRQLRDKARFDIVAESTLLVQDMLVINPLDKMPRTKQYANWQLIEPLIFLSSNLGGFYVYLKVDASFNFKNTDMRITLIGIGK